MSKLIPNSYQTPNAYIDDYMAFLTAEEWKVLSYMSRRIFGFNKRQDRISLTQFTSGIQGADGSQLDYGTGLSRPTVIKALAALIEVGIVVEVGDRGSTDGQCYELQLDTDKVDLDRLMNRKTAQHASGQKRTAHARAVNRTDRSKANLPQSIPLTTLRSIPLTATGQCDLPIAVNGIDTHEPRGNPGETQVEEEIRDHTVDRSLSTAAAALCNYPERMTSQQSRNLSMLVEFLAANNVATERLAPFTAWWQTESWIGRRAVKEKRSPSPPTPQQVIDLWPEFDARLAGAGPPKKKDPRVEAAYKKALERSLPQSNTS